MRVLREGDCIEPLAPTGSSYFVDMSLGAYWIELPRGPVLPLVGELPRGQPGGAKDAPDPLHGDVQTCSSISSGTPRFLARECAGMFFVDMRFVGGADGKNIWPFPKSVYIHFLSLTGS